MRLYSMGLALRPVFFCWLLDGTLDIFIAQK